ncbi:MAG: PorT family protein [Spirosomaceae bacterium]|jgi:hypothetical protein|nr:PorT family protein [Spirosomataceae bacterium]
MTKTAKVFLILLMTVVGKAQSQGIEWGLKGGLQITSFRGDDFQGRKPSSSSTAYDKITSKGGAATGYALGIYARSQESVFLQGEALISIKGAVLETVGQNTETAVQYGQLDIPVSIGYQTKRFDVMGGPMLSVNVFDDGKLKNFLSSYANSPLTFSPYRTYAFGYQLGAGLKFNKLGVQLRYLASIQPVSDMYISYSTPGASELSQSRFQQRAGVIQATVSYRLK